MTLYDFHWIYPAYPSDISPVPWFEIAHTLPHFTQPELRKQWLELHRRFLHELEADVAPERLLIFDVRQGWSPLLRFLEVNEPQLAVQPFPRLNDRASLATVRLIMDGLAAGLPLWLFSLFYVLVRCVRWIGYCSRQKWKPKSD